MTHEARRPWGQHSPRPRCPAVPAFLGTLRGGVHLLVRVGWARGCCSHLWSPPPLGPAAPPAPPWPLQCPSSLSQRFRLRGRHRLSGSPRTPPRALHEPFLQGAREPRSGRWPCSPVGLLQRTAGDAHVPVSVSVAARAQPEPRRRTECTPPSPPPRGSALPAPAHRSQGPAPWPVRSGHGGSCPGHTGASRPQPRTPGVPCPSPRGGPAGQPVRVVGLRPGPRRCVGSRPGSRVCCRCRACGPSPLPPRCGVEHGGSGGSLVRPRLREPAGRLLKMLNVTGR